MNFEELLQFIESEDKNIRENYGSPTKQEEILARTVKLGEEYGELCDAILSSNGDQRKEKLENREVDNLPEEFADVIITTLLLAKAMEVDIENALEKKIAKIKQRHKKI
ncbi:hypothetical protein FJ208_01290 [Candidatus Gribaldobacteria bacterium]|nr:hypothetical protein [Candidatus Gribaldobacteria bacterium]